MVSSLVVTCATADDPAQWQRLGSKHTPVIENWAWRAENFRCISDRTAQFKSKHAEVITGFMWDVLLNYTLYSTYV